LPGNPRFAKVYFNLSQGDGDASGPWNGEENFEVISDPAQQVAVDGGDGMDTVNLKKEELTAVQPWWRGPHRISIPIPKTGAELGGEPAEA
jgi:Mn-containing catalase